MYSIAFLLPVIFLLAAGVAAGVFFAVGVRRTMSIPSAAQSREALAQAIEAVFREFPEEVRAWGGRDVLVDPAAVRALLRDAAAPPGANSDLVAIVDVPDSVRGRLLTSMLGSLADALRRLGQRERVPAIRIFVVALIVGWAVGWGIAAIAFLTWNSSYSVFGFFDVSVLNFGAAFGTMAFLLAILAQVLLWRWQRRQAADAADALAKDVDSEFPAVVSAVGGPPVLSEVGTVERIQARIQKPDGTNLRAAAVRILLDRLADLLRARDLLTLPIIRIIAISLPIAYIMGHLFGETIYSNIHHDAGYFNVFRGYHFELGALLGGIAMGLVWFAGLAGAQVVIWHLQRARLGALADQLRSALNGPFATEVRSWGGPAVLRDPNTVAELSRSLVPNAHKA